MSGSIKVGGHTVFVHTGASGAGTLSVQGQNGNVLLSDDGTAVSLGNNVRLPASGGIKDSSGNNVLTESGGTVTFGNVIGGVPAGAIMSFAMSSAPSGWIVCNGAEYAIADYGDLHTAIGTTWGALTNGSGGAGSTHFRVPDLRGEFLRGFDNGQGNDPDAVSRTGGDAVGSSQSFAFQGHGHNATAGSNLDSGGTARVAMGAWDVVNGPSVTTPINLSGYGTVQFSTETRPRNKYVQYCIKY